MDKKKVQKSIALFTKRVKKILKPRQVLLFGSYATGTADEYSDVDVLVISDRFTSIPQEERLDVLYPMTKDLIPDFHVFGFTPGEYEAMSPLVSLAEVKYSGRPLL